jgi:ubiquitin carboxyl-terminal hydrolase L3
MLQGLPAVRIAMPKKWLPLESNPEVMTAFASHLGLDASRFAFHDVLGLDEVR